VLVGAVNDGASLAGPLVAKGGQYSEPYDIQAAAYC